MNTIDGILYINLDHRKDRLENITTQLQKSPVAKQLPIPDSKIIRIPAILNKRYGTAGCGASHVKALDHAIEKGWNRVLIFEDDFAWKENTEYIVDCLKKIDTTTIAWDVILLSANALVLKVVKNDVDNFQRVKNAQTTSAYIVNGQNYMKKLRDCFATSVRLLNAGKSMKIAAIDVTWKRFQPTDRWYCFKGQLGRQINSYSDVLQRPTSYKGNVF
jgi:glycosyl transferase family 25